MLWAVGNIESQLKMLYEGHSMNKLQNGVFWLIFKILNTSKFLPV